MSNMDEFNTLTIHVFNKLLDEFPQPIDFSSRDDEPGDISQENYFYTFQFLEREGFIVVEAKTMGGGFHMTSLTANGMALMNSIPESLKEKKPLRKWVREVAASGSKEAITTVVTALIKSSIS